MATENVIYVGTFSKIFAPGLRVGYCVVPKKIKNGWLRLSRAMLLKGKRVVSVTRDVAYNLLRKSVKTLADFPDKLIDDLFDICTLVHYKQGQQFIRAGEVPRNMGYNLNGIFRLYYIDENGNDLTKGFSTAGKFVVSYSALVQKRPSYFFIEAMVASDILQFTFDLWQQMIEEDIRWYPFVFKLLEAVCIMKEMREKSFLLDDAATRYLNFRREYPDLENVIKLYHIASFIGITPEALSRIRKKMKLI
jgi:CRP-like cAMP-binding protein